VGRIVTGPWWVGLAPAEVRIACGGQEHRLSWSDGGLVARDHPGLAREQILVGCGAESSPCIRLLNIWDSYSDDLTLLVVASRGVADPVPAHGDGPAGTKSLVARSQHSVTSPAQHRQRDHLANAIAEVLELPGGLPELLVATVVATWSQRIVDSDARVASAQSRLRAALYGRLVATIRAWREGVEPIELDMTAPGTPASLRRDDDGLHVRLEFTWLRDVWCRGLALVGNRLCLSSELTANDQWRLTTVPIDLGAPEVTTISLG
jgi:hypothetical protein